MKMTYLLASILSTLAAIIRTIDGQTGPLRAASESNLQATSLAFFYLTWHMVTVFFIISAVALFLLSLPHRARSDNHLGKFMGLVFIAWSVLIAGISSMFVWNTGTIIPMIVTFLIGTLSLIGARQAKSGA